MYSFAITFFERVNFKYIIMDKKRVYTFGNGQAEGKADMRNLLGGKGANLAEMNLIGVPVPPGFTITTEVCSEYYELGRDKVVELLKADVEKAIANIESLMNSKFGDIENPLLVSVRSGARASMPGMMDTILNLGLNDEDQGAAPQGRPRGRAVQRQRPDGLGGLRHGEVVCRQGRQHGLRERPRQGVRLPRHARIL